MRRDGNIVSYTSEELDEMIAHGDDLTDWAKIDALTDEEVEASVDFEDEGYFDLETAIPVRFHLPGKKQLTIRLDEDILDWFKEHGSGYQTRINAVLRSFVESQTAKERKPTRRKAS